MIFSDSYLCGYYGMQNTGDDALLLATAWGAKKFLGDKNHRVSNVAPLHLSGLPYLPAGLKVQQRFRGENRLKQSFHALVSTALSSCAKNLLAMFPMSCAHH